MKHEPLRYAHEEGHTDVCFAPDGSKFITCGADGDIRIWSTSESEDPVHNCIGEWALCVRQKSDNLYVATGSNDIQILTFPGGERNGVLDRFVAPINHIAISKITDHVALAGEDMEVKLVINTAEKEVVVFDGLAGPCLSVALSPQSDFLAAGSGDGKLRIWNIETRSLVKEIECFPKTNSFSNAKVLCRVDFDPSNKYLAYPDKNTVILLNTSDWSQRAILSSTEVPDSFSMTQFSPCGEFLVATSTSGDFVIWKISTEMVEALSKHPKSIAISGIMWNPNGNGQIVYTDTEGQLGVISDCVAPQIESQPETFEDNDVDFGSVKFDDDTDEDDENVVSVEKLKKQYMESNDEEPELNLGSSLGPSPRPRTPEIALQGPFMPSATPEHLNPRYFCWNEVGVIRSYSSEEDAGKSIEVEFHDSTFHNSLMLQNYQDYTMGSLSKSALVVANSSQLNVIPLNIGSKEWQLKVEEYEEVVLVAASENLIAFATNNYIVRICSIFGTQRGIVSIPGPPVSMSAYKNSLLIAYHAAGTRNGDQCINIKLITFESLAVRSTEISSALGPESTLYWLGFSDVGTPAIADSLGMLSMYPKTCNTWIPFCDTTKHRKSPADSFFVTAVFESYQTLVGIKCKGTVYPGFTPRPTVCELPLEPPFAESSTEKTQMEMSLFAWSNLQTGNVDKKIKETGLKTFALACRNGLDHRATEFMEIMGNSQLLNLGLKYAVKLDKKRLAEKLMELASKLTEDDDSIEKEVHIPQVTAKPSIKRLSLGSVRHSQKLKASQINGSAESCDSQTSVLSPALDITTIDETINTQESVFPEEKKNPFLKSLKKNQHGPVHPLSLTNESAGIDYTDAKENKNVAGDKRKQPESDVEKPKQKQRKLDKFMFNKLS